MALENLFIRTKKSIGGIQLDAVISETHNNKIRLTENPIELGVDITDHAVIEPKTLNIIAEVSDTPLGEAALGQIVDLITGLFGTSTSKNITRSNAAYNAMVQLQEAREPLEIQTKLVLYNNMIITDINVTQDKNSSKIVNMSINLKEIFLTETEVIQLPSNILEEGVTRNQGSSIENQGKIEPNIPKENTQKSVLKTITDWIN